MSSHLFLGSSDKLGKGQRRNLLSFADTAACDEREEPQYHERYALLVNLVAKARSASTIALEISDNSLVSKTDWLFHTNHANISSGSLSEFISN